MAFPCNQFGAQEPGSRCCVNDHNAHNDGRDIIWWYVFFAFQHHTNLTKSKIWLLKETWCLERSTSKSLVESCVLDVSVERWWISDDLVDSDGSHDCGTWLEKTLHELERYTNGKPHTLKITSRKVKTHHLQNRTYFFWVPAVHLLFGSFIYRQFINHLDRQARLRRSRVLSWMLGVFFVFFGWRLVHPKGWLTP